MRSEISETKFQEWMAYWELEPFGEAQADMRAGIIASKMHNAWFKGKRIGPEDVFPHLKVEPEQSLEQMAQAAKLWTVLCGGEVN